MVRRARAAGLAAIALTDHDSTAGVVEAAAAGAALGVRVVPGCELSARAPWGELHVLAYFVDAGDPRLQAFLDTTRAARRRRGAQMVTRLQALGVPIALEDVARAAGAGALGRPHVARALVAVGATADLNEAFARYLGRGRPAFVEKPLPALSEITTLVHAVGGLAVAAHLGDRGTAAELRRLRDAGLDGVEVRHPSHTPAVEARLTRVATALGLAISGGSDWHGDSELGESHAPLGGLHVPAEWLEQLERRRATTSSHDVEQQRHAKTSRES